MNFIKTVFGSCLGFILGSIVLFFIALFLILGIALSLKNPVKDVSSSSVLKISFTGDIPEYTEEDPFNLAEMMMEENPTSLETILKAIKIATKSDQIKAIYLDIDYLTAGYGTLSEIRDALQHFQETGKSVIAYSGNYSQKAYFLASVADVIVLNPLGSVDVKGFASIKDYPKPLYDKLGIEFQLFRVGKYKSAGEKYLTNYQSAEDSLQTMEYLKGMWEVVSKNVCFDRILIPEQLDNIANEATMFKTAEEVKAMSLVDVLMYHDEVKGLLAITLNSKLDDVEFCSPEDLVGNNLAMMKKNQIAVLYAVGEIDGISLMSDEGIVSEELCDQIEEVAENDSIKAVVLRVNSPGGSAYGSEQIWHAVSQLKTTKPVVVSMGDYAASGGYYIACNANYIYAQPATITGSIGVFGVYPSFEKLMNQVGVNMSVNTTHNHSDLATSVHRSLTDEEKQMIQSSVNHMYDVFLNRCSNGRNINMDVMQEIAQGRVYASEKALDLNLIDEVGYMYNAIEKAAELAELTPGDYSVRTYRKSYFDRLMESFKSSISSVSFIKNICERKAWEELYLPQNMIRAEME